MIGAASGLLATVVSFGVLVVTLRDQPEVLAAQQAQLSQQRTEERVLKQVNEDLRDERDSLLEQLEQATDKSQRLNAANEKLRSELSGLSDKLVVGRMDAELLAARAAEMEAREEQARRDLTAAQATTEDLRNRVGGLYKELEMAEEERAELNESVVDLEVQRDELLHLGLRSSSVEEFRDAVVGMIERNYVESLATYYRQMSSFSRDYETVQPDACSWITYDDYSAQKEHFRNTWKRPIVKAEEDYPWLIPRLGHLKEKFAARYPVSGGFPAGFLLP